MLIEPGRAMETVTVSPKYQVVIPSRVRRLLGVQPGMLQCVSACRHRFLRETDREPAASPALQSRLEHLHRQGTFKDDLPWFLVKAAA
jgi:hypothetical protein